MDVLDDVNPLDALDQQSDRAVRDAKDLRDVCEGTNRVGVCRLTALDASVEPPTISVEVDVSGTRYVEDRNTAAVVSGSSSRTVKFTERWTLALAGDDANPWRIVAAGQPAQPAVG